jgi:hypothetical protein
MRTLPTALAALVLLCACAGPGRAGAEEPAAPPALGGATQMTVEITPGPANAAAGEEHSATAEGEAGGVTVRGTITLPTPCHQLTGTVGREGGELVLRVSARPDPEAMCAQVIATHGYTARVRGVSPGAYTLRVVHDYPESGWDEQAVLRTPVTVR